MTKAAKKKPRSPRILYEGNSCEVRVRKTGKIRFKIEPPTEDTLQKIDEEWRLKAIADDTQKKAKYLLWRFEGRWNRKNNEEIFTLVEDVFRHGIAVPPALRDLLRFRIVGDRNGAKKRGIRIKNEGAYEALISLEAEYPSADESTALSDKSNPQLEKALRKQLGWAPSSKWIGRKRKEPSYQEKVIGLRTEQLSCKTKTKHLRDTWGQEREANWASSKKRNVRKLTKIFAETLDQTKGGRAPRSKPKQK